MTGRLAGRIALVTGASRGLGAAVAERLGAEGAKVVLVARTVGGLEATDDRIRASGGEPALLVPLDLAEHDKIDDLGAQLFERFGRLDILVAAAATLGPLSPAGHVAPKDWARVMDVNLTANWRLVRSLDPLLRRADKAHATFVTCAAARAPEAYWSPYAVSKAGLEALVRSWSAELARTRIGVHLFDPGIMSTRLRSHAFPGEPDGAQPSPAAAALRLVAAIAA